MKEKNVKLWTKDFVLIILINFFVFLNHLMILSTFPLFIKNVMGSSDSVSGLCVTLFCVIGVIARPFVGVMLDNGKRKSILVVGLIIMGLMPMGYLFASTVIMSLLSVIICRMAHGIALALSNTSTSTIATDIIPKQRFAEGMGMFGMATALATAVAPAIAQTLINCGGVGGKNFKLLFAVATLTMAVSIVLFSALKTPKTEIKHTPINFKTLINKDALPASASAIMFLLTYGAIENFTLQYSLESSRITLSGGLYFTVMAAALLLTRITVGKIADKKGEAIFVYTCNGAMLLALILLATLENNVVFMVSAFLSGYAFGGLEPSLQAMAVSVAKPSERGSANSTFLCAYDIGIGLGGGIAGVLIDSLGYNKMFAVISVANILSVVIYLCIGRRHKSSMTYRIKNGK